MQNYPELAVDTALPDETEADATAKADAEIAAGEVSPDMLKEMSGGKGEDDE